MPAVQTDFHISAETVIKVRSEVSEMPLGQFRQSELPHMQPGMEAFDLGLYGDACRSEGSETANSMRAGLLVAHRVLRLSNEDKPLPRDVDIRLGMLAGRVAIEPLLAPRHLEDNRRAAELAYAGSPAVSFLLNTVLTRPGSRSGAILLLGLHIPMANPAFHTRFSIVDGPLHGAHPRSSAAYTSSNRRH